MKELSKVLQKPLTAGSDTHQAFQYGCVYNVFDQTVRTVDGCRLRFRQGITGLKLRIPWNSRWKRPEL